MLIKKQKQITLKEMQDSAKIAYSDNKGLFKESEVTDILIELQLGSERSIRKIVRECGRFATRFRDMATMVDTITDFFIDNEKNFLQANSVLNGRSYNPLENYDRHEAAYTDSSSESHSIGERETTVQRGKVRNTNTPGDYTSNTTETSTKSGTETVANENANTPAVIGTPYAGNKQNVTGSNTTSSTDSVTSQNTVTQLASITDTEQLAADVTENAAASDSIARQDVHAARHIHGNIGVTTSQQMATAELQFISQFANTLDFIIYLFKQNCVIPVYMDDVNEYGYHYDITGDPTADPGTPDAVDPGANPSDNPNVTPTPIPDTEDTSGFEIPDNYCLVHVYGDFIATDITKNAAFSYNMELDGEHKESHMLVKKGTQMTLTNSASGSYDVSLSYSGAQWDSVETVSGNLNKNVVISTDELIIYIGVDAKTKATVPSDMLPDMTQYHIVDVYPWVRVDLVLGASTIGTGVVNLTASSGRPVDNMKSTEYAYKWCLPDGITTAIVTSISSSLNTINIDGVLIPSGTATIALNTAKKIILNNIEYNTFEWLKPDDASIVPVGEIVGGPFINAAIIGTNAANISNYGHENLPYGTRIRISHQPGGNPPMTYVEYYSGGHFVVPDDPDMQGYYLSYQLITVDRDFWIKYEVGI